MFVASLIAGVLGGFCPSAAAQVACRYEVAAIITVPPCGFGDRAVTATAISPNGRYVCGYYCQCLCIEYESFIYDLQTAQLFTIPRPANIFTSRANDVNDAGVVVGFMGGSTGDFGYIYDYPAQTFLATLSSVIADGTCTITGINNSSTVCGTRTIGGTPNYETSAFIWSANDGFTDLGVMTGPSSLAFHLSEDGTIVGLTGGNVISLDSLRVRSWRDGVNTMLDSASRARHNSMAAFASAVELASSFGIGRCERNLRCSRLGLVDGGYIDPSALCRDSIPVVPQGLDGARRCRRLVRMIANVASQRRGVWRPTDFDDVAEYA